MRKRQTWWDVRAARPPDEAASDRGAMNRKRFVVSILAAGYLVATSMLVPSVGSAQMAPASLRSRLSKPSGEAWLAVQTLWAISLICATRAEICSAVIELTG